ncbi:MAG: hypothetical protein WBC19_08460 [Pyrinomonadaceae bacterium]
MGVTLFVSRVCGGCGVGFAVMGVALGGVAAVPTGGRVVAVEVEVFVVRIVKVVVIFVQQFCHVNENSKNLWTLEPYFAGFDVFCGL